MTAELWHAGAASLPSHDLMTTAGFWGSLGFAIDLADDVLVLTLGGVELRYDAAPAADPFGATAQVRVEVTNADLLHAELYEADVMPDLADDDPGDPDELRARWDATHDLSRLGVLRDAGSHREFTIFDPTNNRVTCGHPL